MLSKEFSTSADVPLLAICCVFTCLQIAFAAVSGYNTQSMYPRFASSQLPSGLPKICGRRSSHLLMTAAAALVGLKNHIVAVTFIAAVANSITIFGVAKFFIADNTDSQRAFVSRMAHATSPNAIGFACLVLLYLFGAPGGTLEAASFCLRLGLGLLFVADEKQLDVLLDATFLSGPYSVGSMLSAFTLCMNSLPDPGQPSLDLRMLSC